ncbi:MAG: hypothetical protein AAF403_05015 [Pseudomonadota bacterium]
MTSWLVSFGIHLLFVLLTVFGLNFSQSKINTQSIPINFEIITEKRQSPSVNRQPVQESISPQLPSQPKQPPIKEVSEPLTPTTEPKKATPPPSPIVAQSALIRPTPPKTAPKLAPRPAPPPKAPIKTAQSDQNQIKPPQKKTDQAQQRLASILKSVDDKKEIVTTKPKEKTLKPKPDQKKTQTPVTNPLERLRHRLQQQPTELLTQADSVESTRLSASEIDVLKSQIASCWNVPAGAHSSEELQIKIRIRVNADRNVQSANIVEQNRMRDPFYRTAAESALRAVLHPNCNPLKLPEGKYELWKDIIFTFDPSFVAQ